MLTNRPRAGTFVNVLYTASLAVTTSCALWVMQNTSAKADPCTLGGCGVQNNQGNIANDCGVLQNCDSTGGQDQGANQNAGPQPTIDPAVIARIQAPGIAFPVLVHTAPDRRTYTNLNTYFYLSGTTPAPVDGPPANGVVIQYTGKFAYAKWRLVEKNDLTCMTPGSPIDSSCSYMYKHSSPNGGVVPYQISADAYFTITWKCVSACSGSGTLPTPIPSLSPPYALTVSEIQNNTNG